MNWPTSAIANVCQETGVRDPRQNPDSLFRYIDISSVDRDRKSIPSAIEMLGSDAPSRARKEIRAGDILVSTVRPALNTVAVVPDDLDHQIASTGFCVLRPDKRYLMSKFLFYWCRTRLFVESLSTKTRGAHYPAVADSDVRSLQIPLPPPSEQQRIVKILDQADALQKLRDAADAKAERILPALFYKMFGDPATNPKGLRKQPLGELLTIKSGDFLPAKNMDATGTHPVYGGNGINGFHSEHMFEEPVIVVGRVGAYCGVVHYSEPKCWVTDNALYVAEKKRDLNDRYLADALRIANLNQYAGRAGQPLISGSRIYPVEILIPERDQQDRYAKMAQALKRNLDACAASRAKLEELFAVMLHRAFSGELTAKWRDAHTRELLAEMEQQAKNLGASRSRPLPDFPDDRAS